MYSKLRVYPPGHGKGAAIMHTRDYFGRNYHYGLFKPSFKRKKAICLSQEHKIYKKMQKSGFSSA